MNNADGTTMDRESVIDQFLDTHGWATAQRQPIAGDASFRRYLRLTGPSGSALLMDAPPEHEDVRPYLNIARHLTAMGYSAPDIMATDEDAGLVLLEDFGDDTYTRMLSASSGEADAPTEETLYALAVDVLADLHNRPPSEAIPHGLPPYGNGRLLDEAFLLPQWTGPAVLGAPLDETARRAYGDAWLALFKTVHAQPKTLVLRDYHVDNLMWLSGREGLATCGLLDFQDAVAGSEAYDLMSLLEDARRDIDSGLSAAMKERYFAARAVQDRTGRERAGRDRADFDRAGFEAAYVILAAQRHAKVIGIFTRLCVRDGKPIYLEHIPRVWRLLERALEHPVLSPLADWFRIYFPDGTRVIPPCPAADG